MYDLSLLFFNERDMWAVYLGEMMNAHKVRPSCPSPFFSGITLTQIYRATKDTAVLHRAGCNIMLAEAIMRVGLYSV
jgi:hypothetical protein